MCAAEAPGPLVPPSVKIRVALRFQESPQDPRELPPASATLTSVRLLPKDHLRRFQPIEACLLNSRYDLDYRARNSAVLLRQHHGHARQELIPRRLHLHP